MCLIGVGLRTMIDKGVRSWMTRLSSPRIGVCPCGTEVILDSFTNTCDGCGADYNSSGQRLAPREAWGEETGDRACDVAGVK